MNLWLDDMRPAPLGWHWVKTVQAAIECVENNDVQIMSLDHDLGACETCLDGKTPEQWLEETQYQSMPHCAHFGTGYDFVCWMERTGKWPKLKPAVHSRNPVGRARMEAAIEKNWSHKTALPAPSPESGGK